MTAAQIIRQEYGTSRNFLSEHVIGYELLRDRKGFQLAAELSEGPSILRDGGVIVGVTLVRRYPDGHTRRLTKLSRAFSSRHDARDFLGRLQA